MARRPRKSPLPGRRVRARGKANAPGQLKKLAMAPASTRVRTVTHNTRPISATAGRTEATPAPVTGTTGTMGERTKPTASATYGTMGERTKPSATGTMGQRSRAKLQGNGAGPPIPATSTKLTGRANALTRGNGKKVGLRAMAANAPESAVSANDRRHSGR